MRPLIINNDVFSAEVKWIWLLHSNNLYDINKLGPYRKMVNGYLKLIIDIQWSKWTKSNNNNNKIILETFISKVH